MNLHKLLLTKNDCYVTGKIITPAGIMVHSTGANNPSLKRYVGPDDGLLGVNTAGNYWNQPKPDGRQVCVHGFIGKLKDGSIATYQTLPWNMRGWHCGGKANDTHIGFEICEDALTDKNYFMSVYNEAVQLCAYLCKQYNIKPEKPSLICHSEGYTLGLATNHSDVMHWFPKFGKSMDTFRADVAKALSQTAASTSAAPTAPAATTAPPAGASPNAPAAAAKTPGLDTPVLSSAAATLSAAQAWAKGKGSTDTFVSLAQIYWENAGAHGAVNPQIAYAQSAFETSYGKFGGLLDESFCNPCGMKTANGGSDTDKNDSQKFANWTDGVNAHLDHIALYGGAAGYPRANTTDPRHFASLYGTGKTVETLSKSWCPGNANYADTLIKVVNEMGTINPADVKTPEEITVDNAIADGILTDKNYWLNVLNGTQAANKDYVKIVLDNAHKKING